MSVLDSSSLSRSSSVLLLPGVFTAFFPISKKLSCDTDYLDLEQSF